jgi:hypothetical protein
MANQNVAIVGLGMLRTTILPLSTLACAMLPTFSFAAAVATAAGLGAKVAALPDAFAGALAFAAFGVCYAANSLLKV